MTGACPASRLMNSAHGGRLEGAAGRHGIHLGLLTAQASAVPLCPTIG
jgi:hypothetical protein